MKDKFKEFYEKEADVMEERVGKVSLESITHFKEVAKYVKKGKVLDVGCCYGESSLFFKGKEIEYVGLDLSEKKVKIARKLTGCKIYVGNALKMPFKSKTFDCVFFCEVIEHLSSPTDFLNECKRIVKDDGLIIGTTPNSNSFIRNLASMINYNNWRPHEGHLQIFSKPEIRNLARMNDLKLVLFKTLLFHLPKIKHDFVSLSKIFPLQGKSLFFVMKK